MRHILRSRFLSLYSPWGLACSLGLSALPVLAPMAVYGQVDTGTITGVVTDQSGAVLPNVPVTITNVGTGATRTASTSSNGTYTFTGVPAAQYDLAVQAPGFNAYKQRVEMTVGGSVTVDPKLQVGTGTQIIDVTAGAGGATVNTENQEVSQIINTQQVAQLPSLTRNPYDFVAVSGNISNGDNAQGHAQNGALRGVNFNINGQRASGTDILLDGVENDDVFNTGVGQTVPLDSVQEYRVVTNNFSAQYGRASGGVVNVITKAGSNNFHGDAWEFNRLSAYTANTYDNAANGVPKGIYTRNQFGFDVGGPVKKDKLFFFESTEWLRTRSSANQISLVPDPAFLALAPANVQSYFATYGAAPSGRTVGTISQAQLASQYKLTATGPFAALPGGTPVFDQVSFAAPTDAGGGAPTNQYYLNSRVDYNFTDKTQTYVRYALWKFTNFNGFDFSSPYAQYNVGDGATDNSVLWNISHVFNSNLLTNTKLSFTRLNTINTYNTALQNTPTLFLYNNASALGHQVQLPGFYSQITGNGGLPYGGPQNTIQWNQDLNWQKGTHSMQFGGTVLYIQSNRAYGAYAQAIEQLGTSLPTGLDNFLTGNNVLFQAAVNPRGALPCPKDYMTGKLAQSPACSITLPATSPSFARSDRFHDWAVYGQDSWKVTPRFTANYGVRYEYYGVQHNNNPNLDSNFYYGAGSNVVAQVRTGQVFTVPNSPIHSLWSPQYGSVAPRVGFAYDLTGDGKTSIRGGYGISYERNFGNVTFNVIQNPPNYAVIQVQNTPVTNSNAGPLGGASGTVPLPPTSLRNVDQNIRTAQTQFWSMSLERQVAQGTVLSATYAAARGVHLYDIKNYNELGLGNLLLGDPLTDATGAFHYSRPNNQYSSINNRGSNGDSYYNALNVGLQSSNLAHSGLSLVANYTYGHSIDDVSSTFSESNSASNGVGNLGYLNPTAPYLDRGSSDFDVRHRFVLAPIWATPWFKNRRSLMGEVAGNWIVTGIYTVRAGTPFTYSDSSNSLNAGFGQGIPRYAPVTPLTKHSYTSIAGSGGAPNNFVLASLPLAQNFSNAALGGISDFGPYPALMTARNAFVGPGAWNLDMSVGKTFAVTERIGLEFRAEGFDLLNHHNLYEVGYLNDVANYGYATSPVITGKKGGVNGGANDERRFGQFALKVHF
ncbi:MAG: Oar protein [Acidobacteriaceae bacterium]|nr:Oar protein [Acidobacteriaceae bacterium]